MASWVRKRITFKLSWNGLICGLSNQGCDFLLVPSIFYKTNIERQERTVGGIEEKKMQQQDDFTLHYKYLFHKEWKYYNLPQTVSINQPVLIFRMDTVIFTCLPHNSLE